MATASNRNPTSRSTRITKPKSTSSTADQLADELGARLFIDNGKGKQKATEKDDVSMRLTAMKAVNASSQTLSGVVQAGWKSTANPASKSTLSTVNTAISTCTRNLAILRKLSPDDLDVERAALSILGKLVALEMSDAALASSGDMHHRLVYKLTGTESSLTKATSSSELLFIPIPLSVPTDTTLLNIISSYFSYSLTALTQTTLSSKVLDSISKSLATPNKDFVLEWIPAFAPLPSKHNDSVLTRVYNSLMRLCSSQSTSNPLSSTKLVETSPLTAFSLRTYALRCLGSTSAGVIESNSFWDQALKFTKVLVKSTPRNDDAEKAASEAILKFNNELVEVAQKRVDKDSFLSCDGTGVSFAAFCEYWTIFARKAGDVGTLQKIDFLMKRTGGPSSILASPIKPSAQRTPAPQTPVKPQSIHVEAAKIFNTLSQGTLVMETLTKAEEDIPEVSGAVTQLTACMEVLKAAEIQRYLRSVDLPAGSSTKEDATLARLSGKIDRVFERLRRYALKLLEAPSSRTEPFNQSIRTLLDACVSCMQITISDATFSIIKDNANRALDTLFFLSRTRLNAQDPNSYLPAYDYLKLAQSIVELLPAEPASAIPDDAPDVPNYLRCISGAHYNIAGTLYQITRYGNAVPFLLESCNLGGRALRLAGKSTKIDNEARAKEWAQLEEQLYRRWELLAICYSKNGDKKNAYHAYAQAIHSFPFNIFNLLSQARLLPSSALFDAPSSANVTLGQLTSLVDRVTYIGACELLLPPKEVSLRSALSASTSASSSSLVFSASDKIDLPRAVTGILLERQLDYLDNQRGKDGVKELYIQVLSDTLAVYDLSYEVKMPVRRSRVLLRCLEFLYREPESGICNLLGYNSVDAMAGEVEDLLTSEDLGDDSSLNTYLHQYRITAHLWAALHAHKRADNEQNSIMKARSQQACALVKEWVGRATHHTPRASKRVSSPKFGKRVKAVSPRVAKVAKAVSPRPTRVTRSRAPPPAPRKAPARSRTAVNPVTPKNKGRTVSQTVTIDAPRTPPRPSLDAGVTTVLKSSLVFDEFDKLLALFQLTSRILGLLSLILQKAQVLDAARKLSQQNGGVVSDAFVTVSIDLAQEYVGLGKLRRAASVFNQALDVVRSGKISRDVSVRFILRYAEALAAFEDVPKGSTVYLEAFELSKDLDLEQHGQSTIKKIYARSRVLEITAMATHAFASLQYCKGDVTSALDALLQSLRLWTRAVDTLARLNPTPSASKDSDPFDMGGMKDALTGAVGTDKATTTPPIQQKRVLSDGLEWRLSEGLLNTLFSLTELYFLRGSPREAEYFVQQATELAKELNAPSMFSRALAKKAEIHLYLGQTEDARSCIMQATETIKDVPGVDSADVQRLHLEYNERCAEAEDASELFEQTVSMLEDLNVAFQGFDTTSLGPRRSSGVSRPTSLSDTLAPDVLASLFRKQLWNMRDEMGDIFDSMLEKLLSLSSTSLNKAEENSLMARLTLHSVYGRFRTDLFLSSLTESTTAVPMGMLALGKSTVQVSSTDIMDALGNAEKLLWSHLQLTAMKGNVVNVRQAALSLALIHGFKTSLGDKRPGAPNVMAALLDNSVALGLRREMIEVIDRKFPEKQCLDDMQWPLLSADGAAIPRSSAIPNFKLRMRSLSDSDGEEDETVQDDENPISNYWANVRKRYQNQTLDLTSLSASETAGLPSNWTVISINVTEDKSTMFISRQEGGSEQNPLIFCVPLNGRRDQDDENYLTFDAAKAEMVAIIEASDACIKDVVNVNGDEEAARNWWKERRDLDSRIRQLLENMEYCWLGAFKTILNPRVDCSDSDIAELRTQFEKVFHRALYIKEKKTRGPSTHKKSMSQPISQSPADLVLDDFLVRCFSTLSPKCRDEEIEDVVYFILDLYQFHGVPIAIAEVDVDRMVVELRAVLEEHSAKTSQKNCTPSDEHVFLVLDKNVQGFPWESMPILRGRSVSRIPGIQFLHDRLAFAKWKHESLGQLHEPSQGAAVDPRKGYYILNPSGDLVRTEERFRDWTASMVKMGWDGVAGKPVSEQQFVNALKTQDLVVYFGHGGGEQYIRSHKIRSLPTCAATMLWGCSSGALREMGDFDRTGTPHNYMLAGCPTLVANLWDVTDKDIDKFSLSVFDKLSLNGKPASIQKKTITPTSLVTAVAQSRDSCKLKYLTGAAPIVYGIPFYL